MEPLFKLNLTSSVATNYLENSRGYGDTYFSQTLEFSTKLVERYYVNIIFERKKTISLYRSNVKLKLQFSETEVNMCLSIPNSPYNIYLLNFFQ